MRVRRAGLGVLFASILVASLPCRARAQDEAQTTAVGALSPPPREARAERARFALSAGAGLLVTTQSTRRAAVLYGPELALTWFVLPQLGIELSYAVRIRDEGPAGSEALVHQHLPQLGLVLRHPLARALDVFGELSLGASLRGWSLASPLSSQTRLLASVAATSSLGLAVTMDRFGVRIAADVLVRESGLGAGGSARIIYWID